MDSRAFLRNLELSPDDILLFYLDAHWKEDLPLGEEVAIILEKFRNFLILIDDFQVPDDPGYRFDDYGPGKTLTLKDFSFDREERVDIYFPACPSENETGLRRGCILLANTSLSTRLERIRSLRRFDSESGRTSGQAALAPEYRGLAAANNGPNEK
jgi:hypothetical protein